MARGILFLFGPFLAFCLILIFGRPAIVHRLMLYTLVLEQSQCLRTWLNNSSLVAVSPLTTAKLKNLGMVIPVGPEFLFQYLKCVDKAADNKVSIRNVTECRFVPLQHLS